MNTNAFRCKQSLHDDINRLYVVVCYSQYHV